jgi:hypothetical protein
MARGKAAEMLAKTEARPYRNHYSASLRVMGPIFDFESNALGLQPTHTHQRGDLSLAKRPYPTDAWIYDAPVPDDQPLDAHIQELWSKLRGRKQELLALREQYLKIDIFLGYRSDCAWDGFEVSPKSLEMFIDLDLPFYVSVVFSEFGADCERPREKPGRVTPAHQIVWSAFDRRMSRSAVTSGSP